MYKYRDPEDFADEWEEDFDEWEDAYLTLSVFLAFLVYLCYIIIKHVIIIRIYFSVRYPASEDSVLFDFW